MKKSKKVSKKSRLLSLCEKFIEDNKISCPESIQQCDHVSLNSPELVESICEIVGYYKHPEDE